MGRTQKLAAIIKEGVRNPQKIKKGLKVLKNQGPEIFKQRLSASVNYEPGYGRVKIDCDQLFGAVVIRLLDLAFFLINGNTSPVTDLFISKLPMRQ